MRTVKDPDIRKQEILDGAIKVFARQGYDKTLITDIAKEINISQGLCYRYFASKEEIYNAAIEEYADYIVKQNLKRYNLQGMNLKEQIRMMSGRNNSYVEVEKGKSELYELFHQKGNGKIHDQLYLAVAMKMVPFITNILIEAKERGEITISDPEVTAYFFIFGQMGLFMDKSMKDEERTKRLQDCLIELLGL